MIKSALTILLAALCLGSHASEVLTFPGVHMGRNYQCHEWNDGIRGRNKDSGSSFQIADAWLRGYYNGAAKQLIFNAGKPIPYEEFRSEVNQICRLQPERPFSQVVLQSHAMILDKSKR